jgi:predicted outer membrane repeat protein
MALRRHLAVVFALVAVATGCSQPAPLPLPEGLPLDELTPARRELLRVTLAIDGDDTERKLAFELDDLTIAGDFEPNNVGDGGRRGATLRVYGRFDADASETLLGEAPGVVDIIKGGRSFVDFGGSRFDPCGATVEGGACAVRFDENRNGIANVDDLVDGVDAAPQAPFLQAADTLQFPSGLRVGGVARQVIVVDNLSPNPIRIETIRAAGGQGVGVSTYSSADDSVAPPRRVLEGADLSDDDDDVSDFLVLPGEEAFVAVSFSPANGFLTTASVQVIAVDTVTGVRQAVRTKVIANPDGALRPRDPGYVAPGPVNLDTDGTGITAQPFPATELFSGVEVTGVDNPETAAQEEAQLPYRGARLTGDGFDVPVDVAFVVDVPAKARFTAALAGLAAGTDVDIAVIDVDAGDAPVLIGASANAGNSAEAVEFANGPEPRRVAVVLGRVERDPPPASTGALTANEPIPFRLTCQLTRGPEFVDAQPVSPTNGALAGGITVRLQGTGFFVPADRAAGPHARVTFDGVPVIGIPQVSTNDEGEQTITVVLPPGAGGAADRPVAVTVENPTSPAGDNGDGQAVTLANAFRYDLPAPRLTGITPDVATVDGGVVSVTLSGAFFFKDYGAPEVVFDDVPVTAEFVDNATLRVQPPAHAAGDVRVTVRNRIYGGGRGEPSNSRPFFYVTPEADPPSIAAVLPARGSADGGDIVTISGAGFVDARVFVGAVAASFVSATDDTLVVRTRSSTVSGPVDVLVQNRDGQTAVVPAGFVYELPVPQIASVFPARASIVGGTPVIVDGAGFRVDVEVAFVDETTSLPAAAVTVVSPERMIVTTPPFAPSAAARLVVTNADGVADEFPFVFFEPAGPAPRVVAIEPATVDVAGGELVTVTGSSFSVAGVDVIVGGTTIRDVVVEAAANGLQQARFVAPPAAAGPALVNVVNDDGQSDAATLTYVDVGVPRLLSISPAVIHALVSGDELVGFGENLGLLGPTVTAAAVVAGGERIPLRASVSNTLARFFVDTALPAGTVSVELSGAGSSTTSPPVFAAGPDVTRIDGSEGERGVQLLLLGSNLAGDRLNALRIHDADDIFNFPCVLEVKDERLILCTLDESSAGGSSSEPRGPLYAELTYGIGCPGTRPCEVVDDLVESLGGRGGGGGGSDGPTITAVPNGSWGDEITISGTGFSPTTEFTVFLSDSPEQPLVTTFVDAGTVTFIADALPPAMWTICPVGGGCSAAFIEAPPSEREPNDTQADATGMRAGVAMFGVLSTDDVDEFFFENSPFTNAPNVVTILPFGQDCTGLSVEIGAYGDTSGRALAQGIGTAACAPLTVPIPAGSPRILALRVFGVLSGAEYSIEIVPQAPLPFCGNGAVEGTEQCESTLDCVSCFETGEPNDDASSATLLPLGAGLQRWLAPIGDVDVLRFQSATPTQGVLSLRRADVQECTGSIELVVGGVPATPGQGQECAAAFIETSANGEVLVVVRASQPTGPVRYELSYTPSGAGAAIAVTNFSDDAAAADGCTLREAIAAAAGQPFNADCVGGSTRVAVPPAQITLQGRIQVPNGVSIQGAGAGVTILSSTAGGVFDIEGFSTIEAVTIANTPGAAVTGAGDLTLLSSVVSGNGGGGVRMAGNLSASSVEFIDNTSPVFDGGAVDATRAFLQACLFRGNVSGARGGAVHVSTGTLGVFNSTFAGNTSTGSGGAVAADSALTMIGGRFINNQTTDTAGSPGGGAVEVTGGTFAVADSFFATNLAAGDGGALRATVPGELQRTVLFNNTARGGGGGIAASSGVSVRGTVVVGNHAGQGGGVFVFPGVGSTEIVGSHLQGNRAFGEGGGIFVGDTAGLVIVSTSIVENAAGTAGGGSRPGSGGGVFVGSNAGLNASYATIALNTADSGGGLALGPSASTALKDNILAPNALSAPGNFSADCLSSGAAPITAQGRNVMAAASACTIPNRSSLLTRDPGVVVRAFQGRVTENSASDSAVGLLIDLAARTSPVVIGDGDVQVGDCLTTNNEQVRDDAVAADSRPAAGCTLGAVQRTLTTFNTIVVTSALDDDNGCTLRNALLSASLDASRGDCAPGTDDAIDRVVFEPSLSAATITLTDTGGSLAVTSGEVVVDAIEGRGNSRPIEVVAPENNRVFDVTSTTGLPAPPTFLRLRGLRLVGANAAATGGVVQANLASVVFDETTVVAGGSLTGTVDGGAARVTGAARGAVTFVRSTIEALRSGSTGVFVDSGARAYALRSTAAGLSGTLLTIQPAGVAVVEQSTFDVSDSVARFAAVDGELVVRDNIVRTFGEPCAGTGFLSSTGTSVLNQPCLFEQPGDLFVDQGSGGVLDGFLSSNGGRTQTIALNPELSLDVAFAATCRPGDTDQRGFGVSQLCTPGAVQFNPQPICGNGFVDNAIVGEPARLGSPVTFQGPEAFVASATGDINADSIVDWLVLSGAGLFRAGNDGTLNELRNTATGLPGNASILSVGDVDNDGLGDVLVARTDGTIAIFRATLSGLIDPSPIDGFGAIVDATLADVDGDGDADLVVAGSLATGGGSQVIVRLSTSTGGSVNFPGVTQLGGVGLVNPTRVRVVDADGDSDRDVLVGTNDPTASPPLSSLRILFADPVFPTISAELGPTPGAGRAIDIATDTSGRRFAVAATPDGQVSSIELIAGIPTGFPSVAFVPVADDIAAVGTDLVFTGANGSVTVVATFDPFSLESESVVGSSALAPTAVPFGAKLELGLLVGQQARRAPVLPSTRAPSEECDRNDPFGLPCDQVCLLVGPPP